MIAGGDLPDVVLPQYNVAPFVAGGVALDLTSYIEDYAPLYKERLGSNWDMMIWSETDPGRYYLISLEGTYDQFDGKNRFMLQHAVPLELGFPALNTLADRYQKRLKCMSPFEYREYLSGSAA